MKGRKHYNNDTDAGIRPINVIRKLSSCQLTDEEFVKEFFERFDAKAMIIVYVDNTDTPYTFGRLKSGQKVYGQYRALMEVLGTARPAQNIDFEIIK